MLLGENSDHIHEVFGIDVQYQVPRYQRRYVWDKVNWQTLWEDILYQLDLELAEEKNGKVTFKQHLQYKDSSSPEGENAEKGHFVGLIVTRAVSEGQLKRYIVIDGQQRLATFQVIFCVIKDICRSQNLYELADEAQEHIVNPANVIKRNTSDHFPDPTYKFLPTAYDRLTFETIAKGEYGEVIRQAFDQAENRIQLKLVEKIRSQIFAESEEISPSILGVYDYFYEQIMAYVGENCDYKRMDSLINSIKSNFNLIHLTISASERPEEIFESLNATGRKLSEFDYLRNNLFLRADKLKVDQVDGKSYSDIFYDKYWHFEDDSHYWSADRLESFFRAFLIAELGPEKEEKDLRAFNQYRNYIKTLTVEQKRGVEYEFQQLRDYADSYKEIHDPTLELGRQMRFYDDFNLPSLDSFILFLKHRLKRDDDELLKVSQILESYIMRRMLCPDGEDSYTIINTLFSEAVESEKFHVRDFVGNLHGTWPNSEQVKGVLDRAWSKDHNLILYILYRIELLKRDLRSDESEENQYIQLVVVQC